MRQGSVGGKMEESGASFQSLARLRKSCKRVLPGLQPNKGEVPVEGSFFFVRKMNQSRTLLILDS